MSEKYSLEKAQDEAARIREKALGFKTGREESGNPENYDYEKADNLLQEEKEKQAQKDNFALEEIRKKMGGEISEEKEGGEENYEANIKRHEADIDGYLKKGIYEGIPDFYRKEYQGIVQRHFNNLQKEPINPKCKFSLVLPSFREEKVILQALESLEKQTGIKPEEFEVIVVVNYPKGKRPKIKEYGESGIKTGEHFDRTFQMAEEFSQKSRIKVLVIEQDFPEHYFNVKGEKKNFAGVGIASKLGMDLALMRQRKNPQILGYYGADTVFDETWASEVINGFENKGVDGVRGMQKPKEIDNIVEDENGLHILEKQDLQKIIELETRRFKYYHELKHLINLNNVAGGNDKKKERVGVATQTAGMYAHIGGMNIEAGGEDIKNAQTVSEAGKIFLNKKMQAAALGRIEEPRTPGGSYTRGLWNMFRAYKYGEGELIDKEGNLLVDDPIKFRDRENFMNDFESALKKFHSEGIASDMIKGFLKPAEIAIMSEEREKNKEDFKMFTKGITEKLKDSVYGRIDERYPLQRIGIEEAEERIKEL